MPDFPDLAALNAWLEQRCMDLWREIPHGRLPGSVADVWTGERAALMPLPPAFDGFVEQSKRVSPTRCPAGDAGIAERGSDQIRTESLQRSGELCQPTGEPAGLS
jgi:hypothetical protein